MLGDCSVADEDSDVESSGWGDDDDDLDLCGDDEEVNDLELDVDEIEDDCDLEGLDFINDVEIEDETVENLDDDNDE